LRLSSYLQSQPNLLRTGQQSLNHPSQHRSIMARFLENVFLLFVGICSAHGRFHKELTFLHQKPAESTVDDVVAAEKERKVNQTFEDLLERINSGGWSYNDTSFTLAATLPECGHATIEEMQESIPRWQKRNPGKNGFCHFSNVAHWFPMQRVAPTYSYIAGMKYMSNRFAGEQETTDTDPHRFCKSFGTENGPDVKISFDGLSYTWTHMRGCIDLIDDPYCYSLGWLKGQQLNGFLMANVSAWNALAKIECQKIQDEFQFVDAEVTVGRHVMSTPVYFERSWCAVTGRCPAVTRRIFAEHVYTKCQLGAEYGDYAAQEMAYCYYKGCVLPGNRVGHNQECHYDQEPGGE